jgi:hypothetical protein
MGQDRGWMPFTAEEYYTTDPPGYVWKVTFRMAPLVTVRGRDRYAAGQASIVMRLLSLIRVANDHSPGLNQGAMRSRRQVCPVALQEAGCIGPPSGVWPCVTGPLTLVACCRPHDPLSDHP